MKYIQLNSVLLTDEVKKNSKKLSKLVYQITFLLIRLGILKSPTLARTHKKLKDFKVVVSEYGIDYYEVH